jgi:hypothetical protein
MKSVITPDSLGSVTVKGHVFQRCLECIRDPTGQSAVDSVDAMTGNNEQIGRAQARQHATHRAPDNATFALGSASITRATSCLSK